jgi:hypothetical protein
MDPEEVAEALEDLQEVLEDALEQIEDALDDIEEGGFDRDRARRVAGAALVGRAVRRRRRRSAGRRVGRAKAAQAIRSR